ncbi:MAG: hypothetical protein ABI461_17675 [Polyangiaceae bacterium]
MKLSQRLVPQLGPHLRPLAVLASLAIVVAACSSSSSDDNAANGGGDDADAGSVDDSDGGSGTPSNADSGGGGAHTDAGGNPTVDSGSGIPPITSSDGFGAARTACINEINRLRATQGHAALTLWAGATIDTCVDQQATSDEAADSPHQAWLKKPAAVCDGNAQDECEGQGVTAAGVVECLDSMWAEKDKPHCSGCAACTTKYTPNCASCDYSGAMGYECGHYVNMSADWLHKVDCGFSTASGGDWSTQNFSQ